MIPVLSDYTASKIPSDLLGHGPKSVSQNQVLLAHTLDLGMICFLTLMTTTFLDFGFTKFLMTSRLTDAWEKVNGNPALLTILGTITLSYFFGSLFFNQGQSWGMHVLKIRYPLKTHDVTGAFQKTLSSMKLFLSGGLLVRALKDEFRPHDHLYTELLGFREQKAPNLALAILEAEAQDDFQEAA